MNTQLMSEDERINLQAAIEIMVILQMMSWIKIEDVSIIIG